MLRCSTSVNFGASRRDSLDSGSLWSAKRAGNDSIALVARLWTSTPPDGTVHTAQQLKLPARSIFSADTLHLLQTRTHWIQCAYTLWKHRELIGTDRLCAVYSIALIGRDRERGGPTVNRQFWSFPIGRWKPLPVVTQLATKSIHKKEKERAGCCNHMIAVGTVSLFLEMSLVVEYWERCRRMSSDSIHWTKISNEDVVYEGFVDEVSKYPLDYVLYERQLTRRHEMNRRRGGKSFLVL